MNAEIVARIRRRLRERGLDAYLAVTPANLHYATGFESLIVKRWWQMHGTVLALVPADEASPVGLMVSELEAPVAAERSGIDDVRPFGVWLEPRPLAELVRPLDDAEAAMSRPPLFAHAEQDAIVRGLLADRGLRSARVGTDLRSLLVPVYDRLRAALPAVEWVDFTDEMFDLRSLKLPFEVDRIRRATELAEAGIRAAAAGVREGCTAVDLRNLCSRGILEAVLASDRYPDFVESWAVCAVGTSPAVDLLGAERPGLAEGDLFTIDCGTTVAGYETDGGRTFALGEASPAARALYAVLAEGQRCAREALEPGRPLGEVFEIARRTIQEGGYPRYTRGRFGHSIGLESYHEEPPFVAAGETRRVEPGMVLAIEAPFYGPDVGPIVIEDLVYVGESGNEVLHSLPRELAVVG